MNIAIAKKPQARGNRREGWTGPSECDVEGEGYHHEQDVVDHEEQIEVDEPGERVVLQEPEPAVHRVGETERP